MNSINRILKRDAPVHSQDSPSEDKGEVKPAKEAGVSAVTTVNAIPAALELDETPSPRYSKGARSTFKERGSILSRMDEDVAIPSHSRVRTSPNVAKGKEKRKVRKREDKVANLDIFIPSVISVGNLARLLKVRLGEVYCSDRSQPILTTL